MVIFVLGMIKHRLHLIQSFIGLKVILQSFDDSIDSFLYVHRVVLSLLLLAYQSLQWVIFPKVVGWTMWLIVISLSDELIGVVLGIFTVHWLNSRDQWDVLAHDLWLPWNLFFWKHRSGRLRFTMLVLAVWMHQQRWCFWSLFIINAAASRLDRCRNLNSSRSGWLLLPLYLT